ncbi:TPA: hypothetical protein ACH3X3_007381 [Trebouxia sp. C0006]
MVVTQAERSPGRMPRDAKSPNGLPRGALSSHLQVSLSDPSIGDKFSVERLGTSGRGLVSVPSIVHGAPETAEESRETLFRLQRMAGFESQNFDPQDNDLEREFQVHRTDSDYALAEFWKWAISCLIGLSMGCIGFAVDWGINLLNDAKYQSTANVLRSHGGFWAPFATFVSISIGYAIVAGSLVAFVEPLAAGSGIPEIKTYLNGIHIKGLLTVKTLVAKLVGVVFSIAAGLIAGKEGPFVHGGGIVGGGLGGMGSQTLWELLRGKVVPKARRKWGGFFHNDAEHRDFTAIGTAAGVATAFAAPIGGLLFTIEEGASFYSTSIFWRGFLSTCIGVLTLHFLVSCAEHPGEVLTTHFGRYRDFGLYTDSLAFYGSRMFYYVWDLPIFVGMGAIGGLMGALFIKVNVKITQFRHVYIPVRSPIRRISEVMLLVFVTSSLWFLIAYASPCKDLPPKDQMTYLEAVEDTSSYAGADEKSEDFYGGGGQFRKGGKEHFPQLWCSNGTYSSYGQVFFTPLSQSLRLIIHLGEPLPEGTDFLFDFGALTCLFLFSFTLMMWTNGVGASTGMFVPALAVGAVGGRMMGQMIRAIVQRSGSNLPVSLSSYAVVGAAAFMGGATRLTLTATVMVMETTGSLQLIVPLMLTVFVAKVVADYFGAGIDDTHIKMRGAPVLEEPSLSSHQKMIADKLTVSELMTMAVVALPPVVKVAQVVDTLRGCTHQAFPVTPDTDKAFESAEPFDLHGMILRSTIVKLLQHRIGLFTPDANGDIPPAKSHIPTTQQERLTLLERLEQRPLKVRPKEDYERIVCSLTEEELESMMDLRPFMQRNPFVVQADANLSRTYRLFRTMGLRHLFVGPPQPKVIGVVTRKDVAEANAKLALGRKANLGLTTNSDSLTRPDSLPFIPYGAYDPTVGSSQMSHMEPIDEREAHDGIEMNYTLDGEWQNSRPQPVERRSGRRGRDDTDTEHSPLLDRSPGSGNLTDAV